MKILDIDHIELYVGDAMAAAQSLCTAYGFRVYGHGGPDTGLPGQRSILLGQGGIRILLTSGLKEDHPASQFVARHGDGVAVTAFRTESAAIAYTDAVAAGGSGIHQPQTWDNGETSVVTAEVARSTRRIEPFCSSATNRVCPSIASPRGREKRSAGEEYASHCLRSKAEA